MENIAIKRVPLGDEFASEDLYNERRGASFKQEFKSLFTQAIEGGHIIIKKFLLAENIEESLDRVMKTKGTERLLFVNVSSRAIRMLMRGYFLRKRK